MDGIIELKLVSILNEIKEFYRQIKITLSPDKSYNDEYLGYRIFFGNFLINPNVLFIGFNPGNGMIEVEDTLYKEIVFEYYADSYALANSAKSVFDAIGKRDWIDDIEGKGLSTKINYYFLITKNMATFYNVLSLLPENLRNELYNNSKRWTIELIELMNPKYIICEGVAVYWELCNSLNATQVETNTHRTYMAVAKSNQLKIFGISRFHSYYVNKSGVIELLQKEMI